MPWVHKIIGVVIAINHVQMQPGLSLIEFMQQYGTQAQCEQALAALATEYNDLSIGSYPFQKNGIYGANIVIRGQDGARVDAAMSKLAEMFPA
mgnify:CR=1 FL=1